MMENFMSGIAKNLKQPENLNSWEHGRPWINPRGTGFPAHCNSGDTQHQLNECWTAKNFPVPYAAGPSITFGGCNSSTLIHSAGNISCVCFGRQGLSHQVWCLAGHCSSRCHPQPMPSTSSCWGLFHLAEEMGTAIGALPGFINQKGLPFGSVLSSEISKPPHLVEAVTFLCLQCDWSFKCLSSQYQNSQDLS